MILTATSDNPIAFSFAVLFNRYTMSSISMIEERSEPPSLL
jgi:hypothetical protein